LPYDLRASAVNLERETDNIPLTVLIDKPKLSWKLRRSNPKEERQTAYRIIVNDALTAGVVWDTGKVTSREQLGIPYEGPFQNAGNVYHWVVIVWNEFEENTKSTSPGHFEYGLGASDWGKSQWIHSSAYGSLDWCEMYSGNWPAPAFQKQLEIKGLLAAARLYVAGVGFFEPVLDGKRISRSMLEPAWTNFDLEIYYSTYNLTQALTPGSHILRLNVGNGWYNVAPLNGWSGHLVSGSPTVRAKLVLTFTDGKQQLVETDEQWTLHNQPLTRNDIFLGEIYNASYEDTIYDPVGNADLNEDYPKGELLPRIINPVTRGGLIASKKIVKLDDGLFIVDFGENLAGGISLRVVGGSETRKVVLRYGELLYPNGTLNGMTSVAMQAKHRKGPCGEDQFTAFQTDTFIPRTSPDEQAYTNTFTWHGFRYCEVRLVGYPNRATITGHNITAYKSNANVEQVGFIKTSDTMLNEVNALFYRTAMASLGGVQMDCPHRERLGYGGDGQGPAESFMLLFDMERFNRKRLQAWSKQYRLVNGLVAFQETVPYVGMGNNGFGNVSGSIGWGSFFPIMTDLTYKYYGSGGDINERSLELVREYIELILGNPDEMVNGLGDWMPVEKKSLAMTGYGFLIEDLKAALTISRILGKSTDWVESQLNDTLKAFNKQFLQIETGGFGNLTQGQQALGIYLDACAMEGVCSKSRAILQEIVEADSFVKTGLFASKWLYDVLRRSNRNDLVIKMLRQREYPSFGYMMANGATTIWESWWFSNNTFSHNHAMFGSFHKWFMEGLGGLTQGADSVAFSRIKLDPYFSETLDWVDMKFTSPRGPISMTWKRQPDGITCTVQYPPNVDAEVRENCVVEKSINIG